MCMPELARAFPGQPASFPAAMGAVPADRMLGSSVLGMQHPTAPAARLPPPLRHVDIEAQPLGLGTDLAARMFPHGVMAVSGTGQGVGDFVEERFPYYLFAVALSKMVRELNAPGTIEAEAHRGLSPVKRERPIVEPVQGQHLACERTDFSNAVDKSLGGNGT